MQEFELNNQEFIRLSDLLKVTGHCGSGGEAKLLITSGEVRVDGTPELRKGCKLRVGQRVECAGRTIMIV